MKTLQMTRKSLVLSFLVTLIVVVGGCGNSPVTVEVDTAGETPRVDAPSSVRTIDTLYDVENMVTLEGVVHAVAIPPGNRNSILVMAVEDEEGQTAIWAVESNTQGLASTGTDGARLIIPGTRLRVTGYLPKPDVDLSAALADAPRGLPIGRVAHGATAALPDGTSIVLGEIP